MVDAHIWLSWILAAPKERSRFFILYGLGQEKLHLEHRKNQIESEGGDPAQDPILTKRAEWLEGERISEMTEVDFDSWSGLNPRKMAKEAGCLSLYNYAYVPFSSGVHNSWNTLAMFNVMRCNNPLHKYHRVPAEF